jgi:ABC-type glycerol-3-phosphate transport system substrate-binding protein
MQLNSMGDSLWTEDFGETTLETAKTQKVVKYWEDLQKTAAMSGNLYPAADTIGHQALVEGKVGMVLAGYWLCSAFRQYNYIDAASNDLMFVPMPGDGDDKSYTVDVTVAGIFSGTEHPDEAYLLWEYLMCNKETTQLRAASGHGIPTFKSDFECLPKETDFDKQTLETAKAQINTLDLTPKTNPYIPYTSVTNLFDKYYVPYLYGKSTLKEAMQKINYNTKILIGEGKDLMGVD